MVGSAWVMACWVGGVVVVVVLPATAPVSTKTRLMMAAGQTSRPGRYRFTRWPLSLTSLSICGRRWRFEPPGAGRSCVPESAGGGAAHRLPHARPAGIRSAAGDLGVGGRGGEGEWGRDVRKGGGEDGGSAHRLSL